MSAGSRTCACARRDDKQIDIWLKRLDPDKAGGVTFIVHEEAITNYFKTHSLPDDVPPYTPGGQ